MDVSLRDAADAERLPRRIRAASDAKQRDRLRTVQLAIAGEQTRTIMQRLGRSRGFVQRWCCAYRDHGLDAAMAQSPPGRPPQLPPHQHEAFRQRVLAGPTEAEGVCALRGEDMVRILQEEFGVKYSLSGVYELLRRLNLWVLVPRRQHRHADPQAMQQWAQRAPFLPVESGKNTRTSASPSGSRTKHASDSKAR
ncbi:MAG: winged helix-turn-helix domain-containing protein [Phycisphaeraceae bacterium]